MASRPRWERIPRDTDRRLDGAAVARGVTATSARGGWVAELWADGETGPELHVQEWREARRHGRNSSISHFGGKGPSERGESSEHRPCSGGWGETQCFSGGAPLARRQAAAHPGNNRRQNTCAQKTRPRRMRRVWATARRHLRSLLRSQTPEKGDDAFAPVLQVSG